MRPDSELINKIQGLKSIKPRKDWVVLTKNQILKERKILSQEATLSFWNFPKLILQYRTAVATLAVFGIMIGTFGLAQNAMPGDSLYAFKKIVEKTKLSFVPEQEKSVLHLEYANEKLQSIARIVQNNGAEKITPIIEEYQNNVSEAAKTLNQIKKPDVKKVAQKAKEIEESKQQIEALGVIVGETEEFDNALAKIVEEQIKDLEGMSLSETQVKILEEVKADYEKGNYSQALEKILLLSYPN
jgi:hypothetical protein